MTSKEALKEWYETMSVNDKIRWEDNYLSIKKDLELLEILKKHYDVNSLTTSLDSFISIFIYKTDKDFEKIKEWLDE